MAHKLYNTKFVVANMTKIVANDNQLHSDQLQMTRFLVVKASCKIPFFLIMLVIFLVTSNNGQNWL
jgi:hypothetical protein